MLLSGAVVLDEVMQIVNVLSRRGLYFYTAYICDVYKFFEITFVSVAL